MRQNLNQIFWGLLVATLIIDSYIFAAFVEISQILGHLVLGIGFFGYLFVGLGCHRLVSVSKCFAKARNTCFAMFALWVLYVSHIWILIFSGYQVLSFIMLLTLFSSIAKCMTIWQLLNGIQDVATRNKRLDIAEMSQNRRNNYITIVVIAWIFGGRSFDPDAAVYFPIILAIYLVAMTWITILVLNVIRRARDELTLEEETSTSITDNPIL